MAYVERAKRMTEMDRMAEDKAKTGVFTGAYAHHPLTGKPIPDMGSRLRFDGLR